MESILRPPAGRDVSTLADWVEATMAIEERSMLSKAVIRKRLAADGNDDEAAISLVLTEIRRRARLAPQVYPYQSVSAGVERNPAGHNAYDFLLTCCLDEAPFRQAKQWNVVVPLFEHLVTRALGSIFGPGTRALRFGYPPSPERPSQFGEALAWLAGAMGLRVGGGKVNPAEQDGGVDAVAWRPFRDGKAGFPVALAQCTLQTGYAMKGTDIVPQRWKSWISFNQDPLAVLAVPFSLGKADDTWDELHFTVDVILDRMRICELLEHVDLADWSETELLTGWLNNQFDGLRLL